MSETQKLDLLKSHIDAYTRKDGSVVQAHDDKRQKKSAPMNHGDAYSAANPPPVGAKVKDQYGKVGKVMDSNESAVTVFHDYGKGDRTGTTSNYHPTKLFAHKPEDHPMVVGKADKLQGGDAKEAHGFHFAGKEFSASGKTGTSNHDGRPVRQFREQTEDGRDSGDHVWLDHHGNVHADASSDVSRLKGKAAEHAEKQAGAGGYTKPDHVKNKADEYDHLSKIPAEKRTPAMKSRLKKLLVDAGMGKHSPEYKEQLKSLEKSIGAGSGDAPLDLLKSHIDAFSGK